ncbi:MAG: hypothetical protein ACFFB3_11060 [Candidatus Hodarchaeota archaeon]
MASEISSLLSEARILNRRYLVGIFFPTVAEIAFLYILFLKSIPDDVLTIFLLVVVALAIALVFERFAGRFIWVAGFSGGHYRRHLNDALKQILKEQAKMRGFDELVKRAISDLQTRACGSYLADYGASRTSPELEALERDESDYLFGLFALLYCIINLFLVWHLSNGSIDLIIYERDSIETRLLADSMMTLFIFSILFFCSYLLHKRRRLNARVFVTLPVPYLGGWEDPREAVYHIKSVQNLLEKYKETDEIYKANEAVIKQFWQRKFRRDLKDEYVTQITQELTEDISQQLVEEEVVTEAEREQLKEAVAEGLGRVFAEQKIDWGRESR